MQLGHVTSRTSYAFTHQMGRCVRALDVNGRLVRSARCNGTNAAISKPERLSNVRYRTYLAYRLNALRDSFVAERTPGRAWPTVVPRTLGYAVRSAQRRRPRFVPNGRAGSKAVAG